MLHKGTLLVAGLAASLALTALAAPGTEAAPAAAPSAATTFAIDPVHSNVLFKVRHNQVSWFYGRFNEVSGEVVVDEEDLSKSSVQITIKAESVDAKTEKLNQHLRSADFFSVKEFPEITFKSKSVKKGREKDTYAVEGELTMRGVTKDLSVTVEKTGLADGRRGKLAGFHTQFTVDRGDYGVNYGIEGGGVGAEVELTVSIEAGAR